MQQETTIVEVPVKRRGTGLRKPRKPIARKRHTRRPKRSNLVKKLDEVFSQWIRLSHAKNGLVNCYTCNKTGEVKHMQNGHYVSRAVRSLRWDESNCRPQCYGCNVMQGGQPITFRENLVKELGEPAVLCLEQARHILFTPTDEWLLKQIELYTTKVGSLRKNMIE